MDVDDFWEAIYLRAQRRVWIVEKWQEKVLQEIDRKQRELHQAGAMLGSLEEKERERSLLKLWSGEDRDRAKVGPLGEVEMTVVTEGQRSSSDSTLPTKMGTLDGMALHALRKA